MPKRLPITPAKIVGNIFIVVILSFIATLYYFYVFQLWGPRIQGIFLYFNFIRPLGRLDHSSIFSYYSHYGPLELLPGHAH